MLGEVGKVSVLGVTFHLFVSPGVSLAFIPFTEFIEYPNAMFSPVPG